MSNDIKNYISTYHKHNQPNPHDLQEGVNNVKDKTFAPIQITVEQILKETFSGYAENRKLPNSYTDINEYNEFRDSDELDEYRIRRRKEFEDIIRKKRWKISLYLSYAKWEALQQNFNNSRSIFERALNVNYEHTRIWREYINMEIINGNINNARNLYERVTKLLPMVDEFWVKYVQMEQILKNYINVRHIFNNWIRWKPNKNIFFQYCKFEEECGEIELARNILHNLITSQPTQEAYLFLAKFELKHSGLCSVKKVFDQIIHFYKSTNTRIDPKIFVFFAEIFVNEQNIEESIYIYNQGIELSEAQDKLFLKEKLFNIYKLERKQRIDDNNEWRLSKMKQYMTKLSCDPNDFDLWFDLSLFSFQYLSLDNVKEIFSDFSQIQAPTSIVEFEKYIYSYFLYLCYFEINMIDSNSIIEKSLNSFINNVDIFKTGMKNSQKVKSIDSTFVEESQILSEIFVFFSKNQIRNENLAFARKILGAGLGRIPCSRLFDYYISLELKLGNFDRCRLLFTKYIEYNPISAEIWKKYMKFEYKLGELKRFIGIAEAGISMPELDSPENIWEYYIEIMIKEGDYEMADNIYRRLLEKTQHHQVVMDYSTFIISKLSDIDYNREFIIKILNIYKQKSIVYRRMLILKYWLSLEEKLNATNRTYNCEKWIKIIKKLMPEVEIDKNTGDKQFFFNEENYEVSYLLSLEQEKTDSIEEKLANNTPYKLLDAAKNWKKMKY